MSSYGAATSRLADRRRWGAFAAAPLLAVVLVPGCQTPGPQAGTLSVVTIDRSTDINLTGMSTDGSPVTFQLSDPQPAHGTLSGEPPNVTYRPTAGYLGTDSFGYTVTAKGRRSAVGIVTVTVKRPNIVVVMSDDQTAEQQRFLPLTNTLLGEQGTTFSDMVVSYSECCPSRATFLTGQYSHNHGVVSSALPTGGVSKLRDGDTLATRLEAAGYHTGLAGKYLNGYGNPTPPNAADGDTSDAILPSYVPPGWTDWYALVEPAGYNFFDYELSDNGDTVHRGTADEDYSTDVLFARAEQNIRTVGGTATPFFQMVTPTGPHAMHNWVAPEPAPRHEGMFPTERAPRTPATNLTDVSTLPPWIRDKPEITASQRKGIDNIYRVAARSLVSIDEGVERLYRALEEKGELENTLFVYTSDNGYHYGSRRVVIGKSDQYEETLRVPLLVRGPGFPAGQTARQPVANVDLAPTLAAVAGVDLGRAADGIELGRVARESEYAVTRAIVIENGALLDRRTFVGVRDDRWVYIESSTGDRELYDRSNDPYETRNLYGTSEAELAQHDLATRLEQLRRCAGEACRLGAE